LFFFLLTLPIHSFISLPLLFLPFQASVFCFGCFSPNLFLPLASVFPVQLLKNTAPFPSSPHPLLTYLPFSFSPLSSAPPDFDLFFVLLCPLSFLDFLLRVSCLDFCLFLVMPSLLFFNLIYYCLFPPLTPFFSFIPVSFPPPRPFYCIFPPFVKCFVLFCSPPRRSALFPFPFSPPHTPPNPRRVSPTIF